MSEKVVNDALAKAARVVEGSLKKAWSILDAASDKKRPSEHLTQDAVKAIQGWRRPAGR
jgi:DNA polymerase III gamma/tau subunit